MGSFISGKPSCALMDIFELHAAVYDALRVHHDLDLVMRTSNNHLASMTSIPLFIMDAVDGDFGAHVPVGMAALVPS